MPRVKKVGMQRVLGVRSTRLGGLRFGSALALVAVVAVVVLISMPRLRDWALRENERDAVRFARHLAGLVEVAERKSGLELHALARPAMASASPLAIADLIAGDPAAESALTDADFIGRVLKRRGYLFDLVDHTTEGCIVRAWPWEQGQTGLGAFVAVPGGPVYGYPNEDRRCSGPDRPPRILQSEPQVVEATWQQLGAR